LVDPGVERCVGGESMGSDDDPASHGSSGEIEHPGARLGDCLVVGILTDTNHQIINRPYPESNMSHMAECPLTGGFHVPKD
jgi:hypothetical protein